METIFRKMVLIVFFTLSLLSSYAQTKMDILISKTWEMQGMNGKTVIDVYSYDTVSHYFNEKLIAIFEYYFSDTIDNEFDISKVGKVNDGKYIISRAKREKNDTRPKPISVFEIVQLDETSLILKNVENENIQLNYKTR